VVSLQLVTPPGWTDGGDNSVALLDLEASDAPAYLAKEGSVKQWGRRKKYVPSIRGWLRVHALAKIRPLCSLYKSAVKCAHHSAELETIGRSGIRAEETDQEERRWGGSSSSFAWCSWWRSSSSLPWMLSTWPQVGAPYSLLLQPHTHEHQKFYAETIQGVFCGWKVIVTLFVIIW
jgi:hypothetical protein